MRQSPFWTDMCVPANARSVQVMLESVPPSSNYARPCGDQCDMPRRLSPSNGRNYSFCIVKQGHSHGRSGVCRRHGALSEGSLDLMKQAQMRTLKRRAKASNSLRGVRMACTQSARSEDQEVFRLLLGSMALTAASLDLPGGLTKGSGGGIAEVGNSGETSEAIGALRAFLPDRVEARRGRPGWVTGCQA